MKFTNRARKKLIELKPASGAILRIKVVGGGCSGMSYKMDWEEEYQYIESDKVFSTTEDPPIIYVIDAKSYLFLEGTRLDFEDELNGQGWVYNNPSAKRKCGCGSSFSV